MPTKEKYLTDVRGGGESPQSGGISEALMDLLDFAPEWEPQGQLIGVRYQIIEPLGAGRYGVTYRAGDRDLHRLVALRRLRSTQARTTSTSVAIRLSSVNSGNSMAPPVLAES